jgi:hypothetical protein
MKDILDKLDKIVLTEGQLGDLASKCEADHEVQMARADLFKIAKYAIKLHDMMKNISEAEGIEGWKQSKITKAADCIGSVYHSLDYEMSPMADEAPAEAEQMDQMAFDLATEDKMDNVVKKPVKPVGGQSSGGVPIGGGVPIDSDHTSGQEPGAEEEAQKELDKMTPDQKKKVLGMSVTPKPKLENDLGRETRKFSDWGKK